MEKELDGRYLSFGAYRTYMLAALFVAGNILLPQLFHLVPQGGLTWLPIYFFTLVGTCLYGWRVGVITAIASPLINSILFGMPAVAVLPPIMIKSLLLAAIAGFATVKSPRLNLAVFAAVVLGYQFVGTLVEWLLCGDFSVACSDFRIGIPGMLLQVFGGWAFVKFVNRKRQRV